MASLAELLLASLGDPEAQGAAQTSSAMQGRMQGAPLGAANQASALAALLAADQRLPQPGGDETEYWALRRRMSGAFPFDQVVRGTLNNTRPSSMGTGVWPAMTDPEYGIALRRLPEEKPQYPISPYTNPRVDERSHKWQSGPDNPVINDAPPEPSVDALTRILAWLRGGQ